MKNSLKKFQYWEKQLRAPFAFLLLAIYILVIYFTAQPPESILPEKEVPIRLYSNQAGDNLQRVFKDAILNAKESIICIIYALTDEEIIAALRKKAEEGVKVLVVHDPVATQNIAFRLGPKVELRSFRHKGLMHNKLMAIDHKQAWIGSANFTRDSLLLHANLVLGIESAEVAQAIEEKAQERKKFKQPLTIQTKEQTLELWFLPDAPQALERLITLIDTAKKTVKVAMFTFTHPKLIQALVDADKRGVKVQVVIDYDSSRQTSSKAFQRFKREGMQVLVSQRSGLLHEKIAIIDESTLVAGSTNWTKAGFTSNDEALLLLFNLTTTEQEILARFWKTTLQEAVSSSAKKSQCVLLGHR